jgi:RNA polymerase sigma factor (sigma-70 family)
MNFPAASHGVSMNEPFFPNAESCGELNPADFAISSEYDDGRDYLDVLETAVEQIDLQAAYENKVESEQVQTILSKLSDKYKSPLILYYMEDRSYQQIGDTRGLPIGTVMSRLSRGKQMLKKEILRQYLKESSQANIVRLLRSAGQYSTEL